MQLSFPPSTLLRKGRPRTNCLFCAFPSLIQRKIPIPLYRYRCKVTCCPTGTRKYRVPILNGACRLPYTHKTIPVCNADHTYDLESRDGGGGARRAGQAGSAEDIDKTTAGSARRSVTKRETGRRPAGTRKAESAASCTIVITIIILFFCLNHNPTAGTFGDSGPESPTL
jgi:hypothetical protein